MESNPYHIPVLLQACVDSLQINPNGIYVDLTFGGGGHSKEILKHLSKDGKLISFDQDADAAKNVPDDNRIIFVQQNFRHLKNYLRLNGITKVDGILGDLGVSSHQFDVAERGFSIRMDAELDMRMNQSSDLSAYEVVNEYDEKQLTFIFRTYGELDNAFKLAKAIIEARNAEPIKSINEFKQAIKSCTPKFEENRYLAKVFQAIRMEVNQEMEALKECLTQCVEILKPGGRLVVMSYHSLEDRLVKNIMKTGNIEGKEEKDIIFGTSTKVFKLLGSKPTVPTDEEIKNNSRARSAKLRVAEKL
ncbi:MAG: 16S rRNA (cytosine(1402)-N(4))-methyltransferase RsmH [Sphingobacteriaceae bacterium]|nr:16S rRNA (cytosine(1402)-N(4))-methyltransferase RsmH [Sphingobacteriaceae bacterium]